MSKFGEVAVWATRKVIEEKLAPSAAWNLASLALNPDSIDMAAKPCPRTTYLTLCGEGFVKGVRPGRYANGRENADMAVALAMLLLEDSDLTDASENRLWEMAGGGTKTKNDQVEVVVALSRAGLLVDPIHGHGPT